MRPGDASRRLLSDPLASEEATREEPAKPGVVEQAKPAG